MLVYLEYSLRNSVSLGKTRHPGALTCQIWVSQGTLRSDFHYLQYILPPPPEVLYSKPSVFTTWDASPEGTSAALKTIPIPWLSREICDYPEGNDRGTRGWREEDWGLQKCQLQSTVCILVNHPVVMQLLSGSSQQIRICSNTRWFW